MKEYWCETFGAWSVEGDIFQIRLKHYPLLIGFTYDEYMTFKKDICKAKVNKNEFFLQDLNTIRIYNGTSLSENMIYTIMKEKDVVFGLDYETFDYFKRDISEFSPKDMKELGDGEVKFRDYEDNLKTIESDRLTYLTEPKHNFKNLFFDKETKNQIDDFITIMENKDLIFKKWGLSRLNRGNEQLFAFFSGVPGTGKSAAAEAIAKKFNKKLLSINISNIISMYYGESEKNVTKLFRKYDSKDVLLLFDEADALLSKRVAISDTANLNSVKNVLLQELEKYSGVVIFTSNLASNIDPAFARRIQFKVEFKVPGIDDRIEILKRIIKQTNAPFPKKIDYKNICIYELTGGELKNLVFTAAGKGARRKNKKITNSDLIESAKQIIAGKQMFKTNYLYTSKHNNSKKDTSYIQ